MNKMLQLDAAYFGFEEYFQHVTKFRRALEKLSLPGLPLIKACNVSHPSTPLTIKNKILPLFRNYLKQQIESENGLECLRFSTHQPQALRVALAHIIAERFQLTNYSDSKHVLVIYGSSTQWLEMVFKFCIINSLQQDFNLGQKVRQPVILSAAGSFKCGGYFPFNNGGRLHYIPTKFKNNYKIEAAELLAEIEAIEQGGLQKVVCFALENPSALGQSYTTEELAKLAVVIKKYPDIFWLQDCYASGTEHNGETSATMLKNQQIADQGCSIFSFRRDWGGAAGYANLSALHSANLLFLEKISQQCSETYFYTHPPFSTLQKFISEAIATEMQESDFINDSQLYFKQQFAKFTKEVILINERLNKQLLTDNVCYIFTLPSEAGQFGFIFFAKQLTQKAQLTKSSEMAELMCLYAKCRIMPTLLSPMGIGFDPVGVRLNICLSANCEDNLKILQSIFLRLENFVLAIIQFDLNYQQFMPLISLLRQGQELSLNNLNSLQSKLILGE